MNNISSKNNDKNDSSRKRFLAKNSRELVSISSKVSSGSDYEVRSGNVQSTPSTTSDVKSTVPGLFRRENGGIVNFYIVNLMPQIPVTDIQRVLDVMQKYTTSDFMPVWGITASFTLLPFGKFPTNDQILGNAVIYLADKIINGSVSFGGAVAIHMMTAPSPNDTITGDGPQPNSMIEGVPKIPVGTPYAIVPYGEDNYGLAASVKSGETLLNSLGVSLSHEVYEIIHDPWPAGLGANYQSVITNTPGTAGATGNAQAQFFIREICDPTEYGPQVEVDEIMMTNFCYPDYFNPYAPPGTKLDNKGEIKTPLTPYKGMQFGLLVDGVKGGMIMFVDISKPANPDTVTRYVASEIYKKCGSTPIKSIGTKNSNIINGNILRLTGNQEVKNQDLPTLETILTPIGRPIRNDFSINSGTKNFLDLARLINFAP